MREGEGKGESPLYRVVAHRLAERLGISSAGLPHGGELEELARRFQRTSESPLPLYRNLRTVLREMEPVPIPEALQDLAKISRIKLFLTTCFEVSMERAVDHERFGGQRQTLAFAYAPNDKQDLPPEFERLDRPAVFHLLGRLSGTPHSYALTGEDRLEFMRSLEARTEDAPRFLFDKLRRSSLLVVGSRLGEWLVSLVAANSGGGAPALAPGPSCAEPEAAGEESPPLLFLQHVSGGTRLYRGRGTRSFVRELYRRWSALGSGEAPEPSITELLASPGLQTGMVFLSAAGMDRDAAESIRRALDGAGVDVVLDIDDASLARRWDTRLRSLLAECSLFIPLLSGPSSTAPRRFLRDEWIEAILEIQKTVSSTPFVLPVIVDETSPEQHALIRKLDALPWKRLPEGRADPQFLEDVVRIQRKYRSASFQ